MRLSRALPLLLMLLALGCAPPPKDPAVQACEALTSAVSRGDTAGLWGLLTPASQRALLTRMRLDPSAPAAEVLPRLMPRGDARFDLDIATRARLIDGAGRRRVVEAPLAGARWRFEVEEIQGAWRVDLMSAAPQR
ncbi:hypothetical protein KKF91_08445 [Myxococcota bacterium]|nr:hypothetical protein [Myxococcota bacterium]MBU1430568.1 hypothetical protein [Myxococcota bacterium]MBU1899834.1 hypothetical protein [Myxococcota bacterium]